jgi:hypothetical protein
LEAGRVPVELGREGWDWWLCLSIYTRRRLGLAAGILAVVGLIWLVAIPALPCGAPGGDACAPTDHAIDLVPDDALAYAHFDLDRDGDQFEAAEGIASRLPTLARQATGRLESSLPGPQGAPLAFDRDVEPWFGGEAALAILPAGRRAAQEVQLLQVSDTDRARAFADSIASGTPRTVDDQGVELRVDRRGLATALVGGFLAIGAQAGVRDVIDAESGADDAESLAADPTADAARDALPDQRLADAYLSEDGIGRLVDNPGAPLATFAPLVDPGASRGLAAALVASDDGIDLDLRSLLDPARARSHPGFFSDLPTFEPTLPAALPTDSLAYLGVGDPGQAIGSVLKRASASEPDLEAALGGLTKRLGALEGIDIERELAPALGEEAAVALVPAPAGGPQTPVVVFIGSGIDEPLAAQALARLRAPVARELGSSPKASFSRSQVGDATAYSLRVSPTVELSYAIVGRSLIIATDPAGIRALSQPGLGEAESFRGATAGLPADVTTLGYLNLGALVELGERGGLAEQPAYATFASEIRRLEAVGLTVQASTSHLSTDARILVGD